MRGSAWPWLRVMGFALVIVGLAMVFINAEALSNGDAVECDGSPMRPDQLCVSLAGGETTSYAEEKRNEARGELAGYAGVGLGAFGIVLFISIAVATRRGNR